jgi:thiol-disulfide isomerase/thioredoxin
VTRRLVAWAAASALGTASGIPSAASTPAPAFAPEIRSEVWINAETAAAREWSGHVTIVEFWTFGCINCRRTVPAMKRLYADLAPRGVLVIGVHTPEFPHEAVPGAVRAAVKKHGIEFPVALDNDHAIWKAYQNRYWPAIYLVDRTGLIRSTHVGELHVGTPEWDGFLGEVEALLAEHPSK